MDSDIDDLINEYFKKPILEPEPILEGGCDDDPEDLLNALNGGLIQTAPLIECSVPTRLVTEGDSEVYQFLPPGVFDAAVVRFIQRLWGTEPLPLREDHSFKGSGIYALYYHGDFPAYQSLVTPGSTIPIYVGRAGTGKQKVSAKGDTAIASRLGEHYRTIGKASNLRVEDFTCRAVRLEKGMQDSAERCLIDLFEAVWNKLGGFGEREGNGQTSRQKNQFISNWDLLHPGRSTNATKLRPIEDIEYKIVGYVHQCHEAYKRVRILLGDSNVDPLRGLAAE
jgi:hypothetical protein